MVRLGINPTHTKILSLYCILIMMKASTRMKAIAEHKDEVFAEVMARTNKPVEAIKASYPEDYERNPAYARTKADRMLQRPQIQEKITQKLNKMTPKALKTINKLITSDDESIATQNSWRVIEHIRGRPTQTSKNLNVSVNLEDALELLK